jgi:hypothetical protein
MLYTPVSTCDVTHDVMQRQNANAAEFSGNFELNSIDPIPLFLEGVERTSIQRTLK